MNFTDKMEGINLKAKQADMAIAQGSKIGLALNVGGTFAYHFRRILTSGVAQVS